MKNYFIILTILFGISININAQNDSTNFDKLFEMSLEELLQLEVSIASRKTENLFDAPLSTSVITKQEIINSGATSIPEIFRLIPGFIVREQTNGTYDVHIMGYDYYNPTSSMPYSSNLSSLVMIDNRVVFRDFQGGTYWESLPIDINDIERIEVVRGPASALYGPNAVNGVVNIITKRSENKGLSTDISGQYGNFETLLTNGVVSFKKNKFSFGISGNLQQRNRYQKEYCDIYSGKYVANPNSIRHITYGTPNAFKNTCEERYPNSSNAMNKFGVNAYVNYKINNEDFVDLSFGTQESNVQKIYVDVSHTPFTTEKSNTSYVNLRAKISGFNLQASYLDGYQNTLGVHGWEYDFRNMDIQLEYGIRITDNIHITPGINYRDVSFDDAIGNQTTTNDLGLINGKYNLNTLAFSLRNDFTLFNKIRAIVALRADKYNYPEKIYFSYNIATTYKPNDKNLIRFSVSRANKGSNILDTYIDFNYNDFLIYSGNKDLSLMTMDMFELGYRYKINESLHTDLQVNYSTTKNYSLSAVDSLAVNTASSYGVTQYFSSSNISLKPNQISTTLSINYIHSKKLHIKPFFTYQKSNLVDFDFYSGDNRTDSTITIKNDWSPSFYGGIYLNYSPINNVNINLNTYFFSKGTFNYLYSKTFEIDNQIIVNTKVSYKFFDHYTIFANIKNLNFAKNTTQFAFADKIKPLYSMGLHINF